MTITLNTTTRARAVSGRYTDLATCRDYVELHRPAYVDLADMLQIAEHPRRFGVDGEVNRRVVAFLESAMREQAQVDEDEDDARSQAGPPAFDEEEINNAVD